MDDEIMRKMGGDKIQGIAKMMMSKEELESMEFTQKQFTDSIERAQKQMEGWHYGIRKQLFEYDSVINKQRTRIYAKRDEILEIDTTGNAKSEEETGSVEESALDNTVVVDEVKTFIPEIVDEVTTAYASFTPWNTPELVETLAQIT